MTVQKTKSPLTAAQVRANKAVDQTLAEAPLLEGATGASVKTVEKLLSQAGFNPGVVDGKFTARTTAAVKEFQGAVGLPASGQLDAATFARLKNVQLRQARSGDDYVGVGQKSTRIKTDEARLKHLGYDVGKVDGVFDRQTAAAVKAFRADQKELKDGAGGLGRGAEKVLRSESGKLNHAPEKRPVKMTTAQKRVDNATARASAATHADGSVGLGEGSKGESVRNVQRHLRAAGFDPKQATGRFDERTEGAVKAFQRKSKLPVTGRVDARTWGKLKGSFVSDKAAMGPGERSGRVLKAEKMLKKLGLKTGKVDGLFDADTMRASRAFEKKDKRSGDNGLIGGRQMTRMKKAIDARAGGRNQKAFDIARSVLGKNAGELKVRGRLAKDMEDWVPNNVNCANFVSAVLEQAGMIKDSQHHNAVVGMRDNLRRDRDWKEQRTLAGARPGDVVMFNTGHSYGHVVMFAGYKNGRPTFIGSNNVNPDGSQRVTMGPMGYKIDAVFRYVGN